MENRPRRRNEPGMGRPLPNPVLMRRVRLGGRVKPGHDGGEVSDPSPS